MRKTDRTQASRGGAGTVSTMPRTAEHEHMTSEVPEGVVAVVDADEFEEARRDPRVREFHEAADAQLEELEAAGRVVY